MSQLLNLARAAHLVGVTRGALQRMIRAGEIEALDGMISVDELLRLFPAAAIEDSGALERVTRIREESFGSRVRERLLPSQEVLAQRLFAQSQELADLRRYLHAYHELVVATGEKLAGWSQQDMRIKALQEFLDSGLKKVLAIEPARTLDAMANMLQVISAQVTVRPSGRQFLVEGNDSILQAGLKAGLRFSYGCGSGSCGLCKARIVSGEVRQTQNSDYRLTEQERQLGYALLCTHTAVSDVVVESLEASGPADIPAQDIVATVRAVQSLGADTRLLHLQTPRSNRLRFLAGQSVTLGLARPGGDLEQTVALASCPCDERNLHFHLAREVAAPISSELFADGIKVGDAVSVRGPLGDFVLDAESARPLIFAACDTGFGPIKSLIEHAIASEQVEKFALYWLATRQDGHYLANQCRAWAAAFDQFFYDELVDADAVAGGRHLVEQAARGADALPECDVFVAGPADFVAAARAAFSAAGAAKDRVRGLLT